MVIYPLKSSWYGIWKTIVKFSFFWGYYNNFHHIGFVIGQAQYDIDHTLFENQISLEEYIKKIALDSSAETIVDVICMIDICLTFFTAFTKDSKWENHLPLIFLNYVSGFFFFDIIATLPTLIYGQDSHWYWLKLTRFVHAANVYAFITQLFKDMLKKIGIEKHVKPTFVFELLLYLLSISHFLGCMWIYIGKVVEGSWIRRPDGLITVDNNSNNDVYIASTYWVITTLTTVGYGDIKGYTPEEYMFTILVEFLGIGVFSYLMNSINSLFDQEIKLSHIIDSRNEKLENWLRLLEKTRGKNFGKPIYDAIKIYANQSYYFDYYRMKSDELGNEFFGLLKPRLRHRLISLLFNPFLSKFYYMFFDDYFEAGIEFKNDFISSIYSRLYLPKNDIVCAGQNFCELMMI